MEVALPGSRPDGPTTRHRNASERAVASRAVHDLLEFTRECDKTADGGALLPALGPAARSRPESEVDDVRLDERLEIRSLNRTRLQ